MKTLVGFLNPKVNDKDVHVMSSKLVFKENDSYFLLDDFNDRLLSLVDDYDLSDSEVKMGSLNFRKTDSSIVSSPNFRGLENYNLLDEQVDKVEYGFVMDDLFIAGDRKYIKDVLELFFEHPKSCEVSFLVEMFYRLGEYERALEIAFENMFSFNCKNYSEIKYYVELISYIKSTCGYQKVKEF